ncbi:hypothetical protein OG594_44390 [Streptomyces sp. NBC_01214]|uniref:hypothetical protein n=1 Tax=Streptomyces sp. NBC_01214 TaxID=2903777 RepID=UPI0022527EB2|nr:hypothetical protein [Streptomyces sp. NBC_01214]MCX4808548.1 hypothetical protein [Streptomyces sp. NBC_01214]
MDVESVAVELYGLRPSEFTKVRDAYAARARKAGDRQLAAAVAALRRPTIAAWTAGLLARRRPEEAHSLIQLGEALRAAHRTLDAGRLRKLSHDQHVVIGELARTARTLAAEAGQVVSEPVLHEVERILHAVLVDPDVAERWAEGRLVKAPDAVSGFTGLEPDPGVAPPRWKQPVGPAGSRSETVPPAEPAPAPAPAPAPDADAAAGRARYGRVEAARTALVEAQGEAERLEEEHAAAQERADRAGAAVGEAEEDVRAAGERLETARAVSADAATALRDAGRAAAKARHQAEAAARKIERLTSSEG